MTGLSSDPMYAFGYVCMNHYMVIDHLIIII
jgi:hypothetical protein